MFSFLQLDTTGSLERRILFSKIWSIIVLNLEHFSCEDETLILDAIILPCLIERKCSISMIKMLINEIMSKYTEVSLF